MLINTYACKHVHTYIYIYIRMFTNNFVGELAQCISYHLGHELLLLSPQLNLFLFTYIYICIYLLLCRGKRWRDAVISVL